MFIYVCYYSHVIISEKEGKIRRDEGESMTEYLQQPFGEEISFQDILNGQKSLVVFVRHPG